ncbi:MULTISPECIES: 3-hydroxyacyl-CoA dehydrogenase NAD-binding domain-containing protein [Rhizobium]|uniref:3-hydroxyacyl-CoA dehydrogenase n=1 Tax=Rhizobium tropici TaxID=398 RepID=A0A329YHW5_RHITR|nr:MULTISPECIES: 3-hydroxyacyl-CoA dehydrogenase NAD-binding domain-containing protein [Rhizobium]MBB3288000.1 3-hydroxyacyl-CoA dehydrogenase [Rhizobium sp. BK252]MBB3402396.1 3-hydroxyacyl-CoA dehydrogenase [Rhizobium sp. BK289]MBB3414972.1 3-hydroxyacyl-CoA dehydrogenase [Rhizobium sp. BK284]MBB3482861.1 3-hydroxyacyl-CoA dehydrogenase [Rhizobium sp. BK347]MDK4720489.1 3-hydroxyacyl-CoA dehydrogenase NAD-binding domain-containing protein [Rhizobium sp. CNPSo 3968]
MSALRFSDTISAALTDEILVVTIDNAPVNALSADVRAGLMAAFDHAEKDGTTRGIVLTGAGNSFIGGADIKEFGKPPVEPHLPDVIARIEAFAKPVVAAINGVALGGGLEVALACHRRLAAPTANLGLPEVKLGIVPGAGGTQRLPRLTGIAAAIDMIANARIVSAAEALTLGIVDGVAKGELIAEAITDAKTANAAPLRRTGSLTVPPEATDVIDKAASDALRKARGQHAPAEAIRLVRLAATVSLSEGLAEERRTFIALRDSEEAAALRHVFFAERAAGKIEELETVAARKIETIGIVGTGLMGSGIAVSALNGGFRVIGVEQTIDAADKGRERIAGLLDKAVQSGRLDAAGREDRLSRLTVTAEIQELAKADIIIEAVFDDLTVKTELFRRLDAIVRADAILATNTSYLDPDVIAAATQRPERVVGLHFFSPANIMRLLEVVKCKNTAPDVLATALALAKRLGKLPVVSGVTEGFIGNRIFSAYRREAEYMVEDGASPQEIDAALEAYGFPMGPFAVFDMAGLEIAWARRKRQAATRDPSERYVVIADRLCEAGRFGQKTGRGWYAYPDGKRTVDPEVAAMIEAARAEKGIVPRSFTAEEIVSRLLKAMATEGEALLAEGIAARASDIDLVMINGYGFPASKGGPMFASSRC